MGGLGQWGDGGDGGWGVDVRGDRQLWGVAALPPGPPLTGQQGVVHSRLTVAVVVLGEGLTVGAVVGVEVLEKTELVMALGLDQYVLPDQEPELLDVVPLNRAVVAVVTHLRLPTGMFFQCQSVNELPNIYNSEWSEESTVRRIAPPGSHLTQTLRIRSSFLR